MNSSSSSSCTCSIVWGGERQETFRSGPVSADANLPALSVTADENREICRPLTVGEGKSAASFISYEQAIFG